MRISTRARYGLRFLIELAKNQGKVVSIKEISDALEILKRRFARGEIDEKEFERMRKLLGSNVKK